ncbi:Uncharacterised protein [Serratia plymuthica]|nr:Uncharacterised protein [Serratia plymuthica]
MNDVTESKSDLEIEFQVYSQQREFHVNDIDTMATGLGCGGSTVAVDCTFGGCSVLGC